MSPSARLNRPITPDRAHQRQQTGAIMRLRRNYVSSHISPWPSTPTPRTNLDLSSGRVDLWLLFESQAENVTELTTPYRALLTEPERERERAFHFASDRHRYLLTRTLVRTVLSRYAPIAAPDWRFAPDQYGRPSIINSHESVSGLSFNISHTDGLIVLSITHLNAVGVDVEAIQRGASDEVAARHFSASEFAALKALPDRLQCGRFFELWTLKESYIKARGIGLSIPLNKFSFDLDGHPRTVRFDDDFDDVAALWRFYQLQLSGRHTAALCLQHGNQGAPTLTCRQVVPLVFEQTFDCQIEA
jgi:4'-phosphopantetheinyl transferase